MILILELTLATPSSQLPRFQQESKNLAGSWQLETGGCMRQLLTHCMCDFVVGKNYRLQDIQLSKNTPGAIAPRKPSKASGRFPPDPPSLAHSWDPKPHSVRSRNS
jgi:hypothetical protein